MKRSLLIIPLILVLVGCGGGGSRPGAEAPNNASSGVKIYQLPDNRKVVCILYVASYKAAISCDWEHAQ